MGVISDFIRMVVLEAEQEPKNVYVVRHDVPGRPDDFKVHSVHSSSNSAWNAVDNIAGELNPQMGALRADHPFLKKLPDNVPHVGFDDSNDQTTSDMPRGRVSRAVGAVGSAAKRLMRGPKTHADKRQTTQRQA